MATVGVVVEHEVAVLIEVIVVIRVRVAMLVQVRDAVAVIAVRRRVVVRVVAVRRRRVVVRHVVVHVAVGVDGTRRVGVHIQVDVHFVRVGGTSPCVSLWGDGLCAMADGMLTDETTGTIHPARMRARRVNSRCRSDGVAPDVAGGSFLDSGSAIR